MKNYNKITIGFVVQEFDGKGNFVKQEFIASDDVSFEDQRYGDLIDIKDLPKKGNEYSPFDMVQIGITQS